MSIDSSARQRPRRAGRQDRRLVSVSGCPARQAKAAARRWWRGNPPPLGSVALVPGDTTIAAAGGGAGRQRHLAPAPTDRATPVGAALHAPARLLGVLGGQLGFPDSAHAGEDLAERHRLLTGHRRPQPAGDGSRLETVRNPRDDSDSHRPLHPRVVLGGGEGVDLSVVATPLPADRPGEAARAARSGGSQGTMAPPRVYRAARVPRRSACWWPVRG